ncbi:beta-L-arabinofuranosidase domain-containing protein [Symbioplanes lichenis]|uniref:beta-L-arabinofuranosidase domain-containing protein n=1 Tax=Symbioplanes lichenis TaxID=1629072 RepID=UPI0027396713|nr:beta-L-arabinofuranosidase domain-containing protein [Actinoplanes lichenis]
MTSRRHVLQYGTAAATLTALGLPASASAAAATPAALASSGARAKRRVNGYPVPAAWQAVPFDLDQVDLLPSVFTEKRDRILAYARAYPADRILANFRAAAGLDTRGAEPPGGWDDATGNLRGHYSGHFLSLLAQAWAGTGETVFRDKLDYLVAGLKECQDAWAAQAGRPGTPPPAPSWTSGRTGGALQLTGDGRDAAVVTGTGGAPGPSHAGFLAAYPETQFILLEQYATYPGIWAPWYTCHKIMRGLLDAHTLTGNATALDIVTGMGEWAHSRLGKLPREQLDRMWSLYIAGEYGGMNEVMADLHALTGNATFLATARCFDNTALLAACEAGTDILDGKHANQHIPQFLGYLRLYEQGAEAGYRTAARSFYDMVVTHRTYVHGGTGQGEIFRKRDAIAATIAGDTNAESCAAYNMLKVARNLFLHAPAAHFFDYYERTLVNQILASRRDADSTEDPLVTYMVPVGPGVRRGYGNIGTCCGGTGLENHTKYQDSIYFRSARGDILYVNLFIPSTLRWAERGLTVTQSGDFPRTDRTTLTISGQGRLDLRLRIPSWARQNVTVTLNSKPFPVRPERDGYVRIDRSWRDGDRVDFRFPYRLVVEKTFDDPTLRALRFGPLTLIAKSASTDYLTVPPTYRQGTDPLTFTAGDVTFEPFFRGDTDRYHAYFREA